MKQNVITTQFIELCRSKLGELKTSLIHQIKTNSNDFVLIDKSRGDESDLSLAHQEEHQFLITQSRLHSQLLEIEMALARIENGTFGICEETEEMIEEERLLAIPWTRLSLEGAEIRESMNKKLGKKRAF